MTYPKVLGISRTDGRAQATTNENADPKNARVVSTSRGGVYLTSMFKFNPRAVRPFDAQSDKHAAADGGAA